MARTLGSILRVVGAGEGFRKRVRAPACCGKLMQAAGCGRVGEVVHEEPAGPIQAGEAGAPAPLSRPPPLGSGEGLRSPSPLERSPGCEPPSPGPTTSPASPDLDPEAVRGALREFLQELRSTQRQRVRLGMNGWRGNRVAQGGAAGCQSRGLPFPRTLGPQDELRAQMSALSRQLAELEAERDNATSRVRQLQKAVAESEEGECDPPGSLLCSLCF